MAQLDLVTQQNAAIAACMAEFTTLPGPTQPARDHPAREYKNKSVQ
ncbi:hypothetical protein [Massilia sp. CT11-137]